MEAFWASLRYRANLCLRKQIVIIVIVFERYSEFSKKKEILGL